MASQWVDGQDRVLVRKAMRAPLLSREEEQKLAQAWQTEADSSAMNKLILSHMRLVVSAARRFRHFGLPVNDLIQEGTTGLLEAVGRFDPDRDIRFATYATWWIRASIQDYVLRNWSIVRTGTTSAHKSLFFNLKRLKAKLGIPTDRPMSRQATESVATELGVRLTDVEQMEGRLSGVDRSLNAPMGEEGDTTWQDLLVCDQPAPEQSVMSSYDHGRIQHLLADAMRALSDREAFIIRERRLGEENVTLSTLGDVLGVSKERVRQLEGQAMEKLRQRLMTIVGDPVAAGII